MADTSPGRCIRYWVDPVKLNTEGVLERITEPEEYRMPEGFEPGNSYEMPTDNPESIERRKEHMAKTKPTKEGLEVDLKTLTIKQIAKKYGITSPSVNYWLKKFGLQIHPQATAEEEPKPELTGEELKATREQITEPDREPEPEPEHTPSDTDTDTPNLEPAEHKKEAVNPEVEQALNLISAVSSMANRRTFLRVKQFLAQSIYQAQKDGQEASTTAAKIVSLARVELLKDLEAELLQIVGGDNAGT